MGDNYASKTKVRGGERAKEGRSEGSELPNSVLFNKLTPLIVASLIAANLHRVAGNCELRSIVMCSHGTKEQEEVRIGRKHKSTRHFV